MHEIKYTMYEGKKKLSTIISVWRDLKMTFGFGQWLYSSFIMNICKKVSTLLRDKDVGEYIAYTDISYMSSMNPCPHYNQRENLY